MATSKGRLFATGINSLAHGPSAATMRSNWRFGSRRFFGKWKARTPPCLVNDKSWAVNCRSEGSMSRVPLEKIKSNGSSRCQPPTQDSRKRYWPSDDEASSRASDANSIEAISARGNRRANKSSAASGPPRRLPIRRGAISGRRRRRSRAATARCSWGDDNEAISTAACAHLFGDDGGHGETIAVFTSTGWTLSTDNARHVIRLTTVQLVELTDPLRNAIHAGLIKANHHNAIDRAPCSDEDCLHVLRVSR